MDPHSTNHSFTNVFVGNIYESLVRFNSKLQIEPSLATSWKLVSPTVWRYTCARTRNFNTAKALMRTMWSFHGNISTRLAP